MQRIKHLLTSGEQTILAARPHKLIFLCQIFWPSFVYLFLIGIFILEFTSFDDQITGIHGSLVWGYDILIVSLVTLFYLTLFINYWLQDRHNLFVLTNLKIIGYESKFIFFHTISMTPLESIMDIHSQADGLLGRIFNIGNLTVESVNIHSGCLEFQHLAHYEEIQLKILQEKQKRLTPPPPFSTPPSTPFN